VFLGQVIFVIDKILDNGVTVVVNTLYPFSDILTTTITATQAFTYYVRIPSWVVGGTITINDAAGKAVSPSNGLQAIFVAAGTTKLVLSLPALIKTGTEIFRSAHVLT
jgi:hypothetical protein